MASRWINAILWTLVGVNLIALVLGGLITWLAYTIPVRLKQSGLSPEITQAAGFASLLVACLGLCALNYSSHYALNVYGLSCAIFLVLMLFGLLPESWQRVLLHNPSTGSDQLSSKGGVATNHSQTPMATTAAAAVAANRQQQQQHHPGGFLLVMMHFALLVLLAAVLSFAFILARYLRQKQRANDDRDEQDVQQRSSNPFGTGGGGGGASIDCGTPSCTCGLGGGQVAGASDHTTMGHSGQAPNHHIASYANNGQLHLDDIQVMPHGNSGGWRGSSNYQAANYHADNERRGGDAANIDRFLPPLISHGIYRSGTRDQLDDTADEYNQQLDSGGGGGGGSRVRGWRPRAGARPASSMSHNNNNNNDNQRRSKTDNRCRCDPLPGANTPSPNSVAAATLAAKLNQDHQLLKSQYYNTMPNNLGDLSSVYAIKSAMALAQRRALEAKRKKAAKASSGGSMMAMTAAAAAALFGGVVDSSMLHHGGGGGGDGVGADLIDTNMDDGLHGLTDDNFAEALMSHHHYQGGDGYNFDNNHLAPGYGGGGGGADQKDLNSGGPAYDFGVY